MGAGTESGNSVSDIYAKNVNIIYWILGIFPSQLVSKIIIFNTLVST